MTEFACNYWLFTDHYGPDSLCSYETYVSLPSGTSNSFDTSGCRTTRGQRTYLKRAIYLSSYNDNEAALPCHIDTFPSVISQSGRILLTISVWTCLITFLSCTTSLWLPMSDHIEHYITLVNIPNYENSSNQPDQTQPDSKETHTITKRLLLSSTTDRRAPPPHHLMLHIHILPVYAYTFRHVQSFGLAREIQCDPQ